MTIAKEIRELARKELIKTGMQYKNGIFIFELSSNVLGWVGLNEANRAILEINPVVGIRNEAIEKMVADLRGKELSIKDIYPTVSIHLGYIMPIIKSYRPWYFYENKEYEGKVKKMVATINKFGRNFMVKNVELDALCKSMIKYGEYGANAYRLPVAYFLMGRPTLAKEFILSKFRNLGDSHPWDLEYKEYAQRFLERLKT